MNLLYRIDEILLGYTEHLARFIYRWIGVNNFGMSKYVLIFSGLLQVMYAIIQNEFVKKLEVTNWFIVCVFLVIILLFWTIIVLRYEKCIKYDTKNSAEPELRLIRTQFTFISVFMVGVSYPMDIFYGPAFEILSSSCFGFSLVFLTSAFFFASINPEPPSKSKLQKGIDKLKDSRLFPSPLPSPAQGNGLSRAEGAGLFYYKIKIQSH